MSNSREGDRIELLACSKLMEIGCEVFRNQSCVGPIDIVVLTPAGNLLGLDIKKASSYVLKDGSVRHSITKPTKRQVELGVELVYFKEDTETFVWGTETMRLINGTTEGLSGRSQCAKGPRNGS